MVDGHIKVAGADRFFDIARVEIRHQVHESRLGFLRGHGRAFYLTDCFMSTGLGGFRERVDVVEDIRGFGYSEGGPAWMSVVQMRCTREMNVSGNSKTYVVFRYVVHGIFIGNLPHLRKHVVLRFTCKQTVSHVLKLATRSCMLMSRDSFERLEYMGCRLERKYEEAW